MDCIKDPTTGKLRYHNEKIANIFAKQFAFGFINPADNDENFYPDELYKAEYQKSEFLSEIKTTK